MLRRLEAADLVVQEGRPRRFRIADPALAAYLRVGGVTPEPAPAVLGEEGERIATRHLMSQGFRPVYQSYRSLGPADLVTHEPGRRLAVQVKRRSLPIYISDSEYQSLLRWANRENMQPLLCQVEPRGSEPDTGADNASDSAFRAGTVRYWRWGDWKRTGREARGRRRRFDLETSAETALELLPKK